MEKQKYVRLKLYDTIIIFDPVLDHSDFKNFNPVSAGFCYVTENSIDCFGNSVSLDLKSDPNDTFCATKQVYGFEKALKL